ncbi:MAG: Jag N-terminal domain-containing protein [Deltaproteobacteria bacterium]|nr:Jag N-terminal domain-containing protein [Deltaproteobacteria bacterium]
MKGYVEFTGKTLDEAIQDACAYFAVEREKLEIEIINDSKTGIFGLVGAKKAALRARRVQPHNINLNFQDKIAAEDSKPRPKPAPEALTGVKLEALSGNRQKALPEAAPKALPAVKPPSGSAASATDNSRPGKHQKTQQGKPLRPTQNASETGVADARREKNAQPAENTGMSAPQEENNEKSSSCAPQEFPQVALESIDQALLRETVLDALEHLVLPIVGPTKNTFRVDEDRVWIQIDCAGDQGLLIGRDGQSLAALQYLLSCIVSRRLNVSINVQIDVGEYREKQNEKLRELALHLAQKVKAGARPQSTRAISAYQRRIIHMALQDDPDVQTHSKGEGSLKRVVIIPRRKNPDPASAKDA